jgi:hypothetical protein
VQLVNGKKRPDALKDDAVSLNFFTEPPAKLPDKNQVLHDADTQPSIRHFVFRKILEYSEIMRTLHLARSNG